MGVLSGIGRVSCPAFLCRPSLNLRPASLDSGRFQSTQVNEPTRLPFSTEFTQVFPRVQPGVVPVIEQQAYGIVANRFHGAYADLFLAAHQHALAAAMP